jgi:hypothetical protein
VVVTGTGFVSGMTVAQTNGSGLTVTALTPTSLTLSVTAGTPGSDSITLTNPDGGTTSFSLVVDPPPVINSASPGSFLVSTPTTLTLTGTGFVSGLTVSAASGTFTVGAVTGTSITLNNFNTSTTGPDLITVTNPDGGVSTYSVTVNPPPTITSVTGNPVVVGQAKTLTINGTGFQSGLTVTASNGTWTVGAVTSTTVTLTNFKATSAGADVLTVTNPDGGSATFSLTADAAPTITTFTPTAETHNTTTAWTVTGTGFVSGATVTITENGTALTGYSLTSLTATQIKFNAKTLAAPTSGKVTIAITVTNPDGGTVTSSNANVTAS